MKKQIYMKNNTWLHLIVYGSRHIRQWPGRPGFNPRSRHTKDSKNGISYLLALTHSEPIQEKISAFLFGSILRK